MSDWSEVVRCRFCYKRYTYDCPMFHIEYETYNDQNGQWYSTDYTNDNGFCDHGEYHKWQNQ